MILKLNINNNRKNTGNHANTHKSGGVQCHSSKSAL